MSIEKLNSAAWAAGFAMAPTEDDAMESAASAPSAKETEERVSRWSSAKVPALPSPSMLTAAPRQWLTVWQRKATA